VRGDGLSNGFIVKRTGHAVIVSAREERVNFESGVRYADGDLVGGLKLQGDILRARSRRIPE